MDLNFTRTDFCPPDRKSPGWQIDLIDQGQSVSQLWVVDRNLRIGGAILKMGGISTVGTHEKYRGQGLATLVMQAAIKLMEREGYDVSLLHGIPNFYHRFGYVSCIPEYEIKVSVETLSKILSGALTKPKLKLRVMVKQDRKSVLSLYHQESQTRSGSVVRDAQGWKGFTRSAGFFMKAGVRVVVDSQNQVQGYVVFDDNQTECKVSEIGGNREEGYNLLLSFLKGRAEKLGTDSILLTLPPDHSFSLYCRNFNCESRIQFSGNGGFMGRMIRFSSFMEKMASGMVNQELTPNRKLSVKTELGGCTLDVRGKEMGLKFAMDRNPVKLDASSLLQLVLGYYSASHLKVTGKLVASATQIALLNHWFPMRNPNLNWEDRF